MQSESSTKDSVTQTSLKTCCRTDLSPTALYRACLALSSSSSGNNNRLSSGTRTQMQQQQQQKNTPISNSTRKRPVTADGLCLRNLPELNSTTKEGAERFAARLPPCVHYYESSQHWVLPLWLEQTALFEKGPDLMASNFKKIQEAEQHRLQSVMTCSKFVENDNSSHHSPFSMASAIENNALNRYANIWPYEYNRIKLVNGSSGDYINASLIQYTTTTDAEKTAVKEQHYCYRNYIATQGPLPATYNDFWTMVWEQRSSVIVMLTKEEEMNNIKCHRYWPSEEEDYGSIHVKCIEQDTKKVLDSSAKLSEEQDTITIRTFEVSKRRENGSSEKRRVYQLQYDGWQDQSVPNNPLGILELIALANKLQTEKEEGPMVVHCSAGCGRTGTFCTIDTVLARLTNAELADDNNNAEVDLIYQTVSKFREQRVSMVQSLKQFVFCYEAIVWWMMQNKQ